MVGSCEAWHCRVTLSPWLMSALEGASVILVASVCKGLTCQGNREASLESLKQTLFYSLDLSY